ncbi:MAG: DUF1801 domain-containing protein [Alphaproteobacteria bacterium]|nr:DUF1801 domain-containing protein [Alphaproteobacteria bacterium]
MPKKTVDDYIASLSSDQAAMVTALRALVRQHAPGAEEAVKWSQPTYSLRGPICYIKAHKAHINFGFWWGARLDDPSGLLEGTGEKMRHVRLQAGDPLDTDALGALVQQAVTLNQSLGDPTKIKA